MWTSDREHIDLEGCGMEAGNGSGRNFSAGWEHAHSTVLPRLLCPIQGTIGEGKDFFVSDGPRIVWVPRERSPSDGTRAKDALIVRGRKGRVGDGGENALCQQFGF